MKYVREKVFEMRETNFLDDETNLGYINCNMLAYPAMQAFKLTGEFYINKKKFTKWSFW